MKKKNQHRTQLALLLTGAILILLTYFYYPNLDKSLTKKDIPIQEKLDEKLDDKQSTTFENVKYKGIYDLDKSFTIEAEKAYILNEGADVVFMKNMHVVLYLTDGRIVNITSLEGKYNKNTYDCFFEKEVRATDGETEILADNLDLLATENYVKVYNNVDLNYTTGSLKADKIDYNFETKYFKVSMYEDRMIKMKVFKWAI